MPEISVLMATYNDNPVYVGQAIDSILSQTFTDFEFLICDDGSNAEFAEWLRGYCKKDARIRRIRNRRNQGLAAALNRCMALASGRYLARMDADDISRTDRLEKQAAFLNDHPEYAFVGCNARLFGVHGIWGERRMEEAPDKASFLRTSPFIHPSVMFRRETLAASGGYRRSRQYLRAEDYELFMRLYAAGQRGYNMQKMLIDYREDRNAYQKRKYRYRFCECATRLYGFQRLGILKGNVRYVLKPLLAGMIPGNVMERIRKKRYQIRTGKKS